MYQSRKYIEDELIHQVTLASIHALTITWIFITVSSKIFSLIIILMYIYYTLLYQISTSVTFHILEAFEIYIALCR